MWNYLGKLLWVPLLYLGWQIHLALLAWGWSPLLTFVVGMLCGVILLPFLVVNILALVKYGIYDWLGQRKREKSK